MERVENLEIRPLAPGDVDTVARLLEGLSARSRQLRFLTPMPRISSWLVDRLAAVDDERHVALVAWVDGQPVGEARFVRSRTDPELADFAVAVVDDYQRRGIGSALTQALAAEARRAGVRRFSFDVSPENRPVLATLSKVGSRKQLESGVITGDTDVVRWIPRRLRTAA